MEDSDKIYLKTFRLVRHQKSYYDYDYYRVVIIISSVNIACSGVTCNVRSVLRCTPVFTVISRKMMSFRWKNQCLKTSAPTKMPAKND